VIININSMTDMIVVRFRWDTGWYSTNSCLRSSNAWKWKARTLLL